MFVVCSVSVGFGCFRYTFGCRRFSFLRINWERIERFVVRDSVIVLGEEVVFVEVAVLLFFICRLCVYSYF